MKSVADIDLKRKRVLVRCDFNVPMDHRRIVNTARIDASLETIQHILIKLVSSAICFPRVDTILIGGAMAYTFLAARGEELGNSLVESDRLELARELLAEAHQRRVAFVLPSDHVVARSPEKENEAQTVEQIPIGMMGLDIGPVTVDDFGARLEGAKTVIWNGPLATSKAKVSGRGLLGLANQFHSCQELSL